MLLKSFTMKGERIKFTLEQCPTVVTNQLVALVGNPGSSLIRLDTIVRGNPETALYEGDCVYQENKYIGIIVYKKGFYLQKVDGELRKFTRENHIEVKEGSDETCAKAVCAEGRTPLLMAYKGKIITIQSIINKVGDCIAMVGTDRLVSPRDILFFTGFNRENDAPICFGEIYNGGEVVLINNLPAIKKGTDEFILLQ